MPLDKSRIQGFGSDTSFQTAASSSAAPSVSTATKCPAGHTLRPWSAKPGWCDGCGGKIKSGQEVMDCRSCNYYLCNTCAPYEKVSEEEGSSFWGALSSLGDQMSGPAVQSALDNVALTFGDVIDAAAQDVSEMVTDLKSFVASTIGLDEEDEDEEQRQAEETKKKVELASPRSRQECVKVIADFCEKYPAARVRPNTSELDALWVKCSVLKTAPLVSAIYDQLSYANGDTSWQPRLRILCALEHLYLQGGLGKDVALGVMAQAKGIILHLGEVPQCAEKTKEVLFVLSGKGPQAKDDEQNSTQKQAAPSQPKTEKVLRSGNQPFRHDHQEATPKAAATAPRPSAPAADLLDISPVEASTAPASSSTSKAPVQTLSDLDLLSVGDLFATPAPAPVVSTSSALPQDLDLFATPATSSKPAATKAPSELLADVLATPQQNAFGSFPHLSNVGSGGYTQPSLPLGGNVSSFPGVSGGFEANRGNVGVPPLSSFGAPLGSSEYRKAGLPYIPAVSELTPIHSEVQDPFSFVTDLTGIGDAPNGKKLVG